MDDQAAELAQISFFLAKKETTAVTIFDPDKNVHTQLAAQQHEFEIEDAKCHFSYFETKSNRTNPPWMDFVNENLPQDKEINFATTVRSANGILLVVVNGRVFAATFGRSAGSYLDKTALEPDFGIKTAMNLCGNEEIRQTRSQSHAITPTQIDRQVGKPSDSFVFGLSEAEDLRYISAHMKGSENVTLQGRDNLTVKIVGKQKLRWNDIVEKCKAFLDAYNKKYYELLFPNYKNFRSASDEESDALDGMLLEALRERDFQNMQLGIPEFVQEDTYSYSYTNNRVKPNTIYAFLKIDQLNKMLKLDDMSIGALKNRFIYAYSHEEDKVLSYRRWPIYKCISYELDMEGKYFVLSDGRWLQVEEGFYDSVIKFTENVIHEEPFEALFENIDISDQNAKQNLERIFNREVCIRSPRSILFDRAKLKIGEGPRNKEFCDILDLNNEGRMRIIHCKPYKDSSSTSYLFSQAQLYSEAFLRDKTFLEEIRNYINNSQNANRDQYLNYISADLAELNGQDYIICLWLLYDQHDQKPDRMGMPLMAQYELKLMYDRLRYTFKFKDVILRFVPVQKSQFTTSKKPAA